VPSHEGTLAPPANTIELVLPSAHQSPQPRQQIDRFSHFGATVCKTVRPTLSNRCLSCLSVTLVYYGQTVRWIRMPLGVEVGLGQGHIVLDGTQPPTERGTSHCPVRFSAHFALGRSPISPTAELLLHSARQSGVWYVGAIWRIRSKLCFLWPTRVHNPNSNSIGSTIFAQQDCKTF